MKRALFIAMCTVALFITGCAATPIYKQLNLRSGDTAVKLENNKSVFVATPANGNDGSMEYQKSGQMTAQAVRAAFVRYTNRIFVSKDCGELQSCLEEAKTANYDYLVFPDILYWQDRATEWSGKLDQIAIKLSLFNVPKKIKMQSIIIKGKSAWATFGGYHPQDLLLEPINNYVSSLYR